MTIVTGVFRSREDAEAAISKLENRGIKSSEISLILSDEARRKMFADENRSSNVSKGAGSGAAIGGTLGAIVGALAAISSVAVPGIGLFAAGPIVAALTGAGAGVAAGGLAGALVGAGMPEDEANLYATELKSGRALVTVHTSDDVKTAAARQVLKPYGVSRRAAA